MICGKANCNTIITDHDSLIKCAGFCEKTFHGSCVNLNRTTLQLLNTNKNLNWFCNECVIIHKSGLQNLLNINEELNKIKSENELNLRATYQLMKDDFNQRFNKIEEIIGASVIKENCCKETFTEIMKRNENTNKKIVDPVVVIKPKNKKQSIEKTKSDLKNSVNAEEIQPNGLINASEGGIIVRCRNAESSEKVKDILEEKMKDNYDVKIPNRKNPRLKIVNVEDCPESLEKIKEILIKQNDNIFVNPDDLKIIARLSIQRSKKIIYYSIIIETSSQLYNSIMKRESPTVNFGWNKCRIFDAVHIRRCFNCCSYSHVKEDCDREIVCFKCGGQHKSVECKSSEEKCINCMSSNQSLHTDIDVKHNALSLECPVYQRILKVRKRNINYD